jgi:hypothetical protein
VGVSGVEESERPHEEEDTGSVSSLGMVLKTPLCLIVLQQCLGRGCCDIQGRDVTATVSRPSG